ncbi:TPA: eae-like domain protein [Escherichia coli]
MESNIKGLVAAGHEMASELKAECGAVDMRSVAKLISDLATQLEVQLVRANALAAENAGLKAFKTAVYQQMGVGCDAPEFSITTGLSNLRRFADTLHAIEREFFTKELPDEEHEGETFNECPLSWGMSVEQYVSEFRKCLSEVRAQGVEMYADNLDNGADDAERGGFDDAVKFLRSEASGVRLFADQLRKGGNQ